MGRRPREGALSLGPRKKAYVQFSPPLCHPTEAFGGSRTITDPLVHHGRHFGRTVHALCRVHTLLTNGLLREVERAEEPEESFTPEYVTFATAFLLILVESLYIFRERREYKVYRQLLQMVPGLEERLVSGSDEEVTHIGDLVCIALTVFLSVSFQIPCRFKKGPRPPDQTIQRV